MDAKNQSHWWWFDSHNSSNCSPWLESTLAELNEKTMTMLKLVEDDADSFAQRAEMYYRKRPELISLVEDFYRAHRSLAERYDQLKSERSVQVKSPLRNLLCPPKAEYENGFDSTCSIKSFDSFTEVAYSSDESAESEVDDPELEDDFQVDLVEGEKGNLFSAWAGIDELTKLREELDLLREENEIQRKQIKDSNREKEELVNELKKLREQFEAIKDENRQTVVAPFEVVKTLKCDVVSLKLYDMDKNEQVKLKEKEEVEVTVESRAEKKTETTKLWDEMQTFRFESMKQRDLINLKDGEIIEVVQKFEEAKQELMKIEAENRVLKDALKHEEEKMEVIRLFEEAGIELAKLREETQTKDMYIKKLLLLEEQLKSVEEEKVEAKRQLDKTTKELINLREEGQRKDRCLIETLEEKDDEKRAVIRQLTLAMEILREDNKLLKKAIVKDCSKKRSPQFQMFEGVQLSKMFKSSSRCHSSVLRSWY